MIYDNCPDFQLCKKFGRHVHGRIYENYIKDPDKWAPILLKSLQSNQSQIINNQHPNLLEKGFNFIKSSVKHIAGGCQICSDEEQQRRINTCKACSEITPQNTCRVCGCNLKMKTSWQLEECPLGKWAETEKIHNQTIQPSGLP